jgi:hypothetical protein
MVVWGDASTTSRALTTSTTYSHEPPSTSDSRCARLNRARSAATLRGSSTIPSSPSSATVNSCGRMLPLVLLRARDMLQDKQGRNARELGHYNEHFVKGVVRCSCDVGQNTCVRSFIQGHRSTAKPGRRRM